MAAMKVKQASPERSNKGKDTAVFPIEKLPYTTSDMKNKYEDILGPLSIFAPFYHEEVPEKQDLSMERPVTPIDESIKAPPSTYQDLAKLIRRRIAADPDCVHLSVNDQQILAGIIMGEVNSIWPDIRRQVDDSFLTPHENKELQRRITVHIVTVCQQLFQHYVRKATILNERGIFSGPANMSRLKAQLSLDTTKFLNILIIRRHIVADMLGQVSDSECESGDEPIEETPGGPLSYQKMIKISRPKRKKHYKQTVQREIHDLYKKMPSIDIYKVLDYMPDVEVYRNELTNQKLSSISSRISEKMDSSKHNKSFIASEPKADILRRSISLPQLAHETLEEELGLNKSELKRCFSTTYLSNQHISEESVGKAESITVEPDSKQYLKRDLDRLSAYHSARVVAQDEQIAEDEDLPPLLQAVGDTTRSNRRRELMKEHLKKMQEKRLEQEQDDIVYVSEPTHPQPSTKTTKFNNNTIIRTSDVRVSERVNMSSVTLQLNHTVFNQLENEVSAATIKKMDSNLFRGEEIREVYNEIMKTLPTDHMDFDVDDFVEPPGPYIDLNNLVNTASLMKSRKERILNTQLRKQELPPWGVEYEQWCNSPIFNASFAKPRPQRNSASPLTKGTGAFSSSLNLAQDPGYSLGASMSGSLNYDGLQQKGPGQRALMDNRNERSYLSWLAWWKNTVSSEDYIKFLTTQESDFMGAIFHMYESEPEEDENDEKRSTNSAKALRLKEREEKLNKLKSKKNEFTSGMWNVNSVMLGGLGNDPEVEVDDELDEENQNNYRLPIIRRSHVRSARTNHAQSPASMKSNNNGQGLPGASSIDSRPSSRNRSSAYNEIRKSPGRISEAADTIIPSPQHRLEKIWISLQVPDNLRLDMAIKYSSDGHVQKLDSCIEHWEVAAALVLEREAILGRLETFERLASDPNRFFQKGYRGLATARLEEARERSKIYFDLEELDKKVKKKLQYVFKEFGDVVTFQGRPYLEKIKLDRTEMLYWLQQERRQHALERHAMVQEYKLKMAELPPLGAI